MDGMLSQDEINALLQGMDLSDTADGSDRSGSDHPGSVQQKEQQRGRKRGRQQSRSCIKKTRNGIKSVSISNSYTKYRTKRSRIPGDKDATPFCMATRKMRHACMAAFDDR